MLPKIKMYLILELLMTAVIGGWQYYQKGADSAILVGITILISFSPFCLALSSPIVLRLAKRMINALDIKIASTDSIVNLSTIDTVAISMNNIVTDGNYYVTDLVPEGLSQSSLLAFAASVEQESTHVLGRKILETAEHRKLNIQPISAFREVPNCGVEGLMNGMPIRVGRPRWIEDEGVRISAELLTKVDQLAARGKTPVMLSMGKMARGIIALKDEIDDDARTFLGQLKQIGLETVMLSGDPKKTVNAVAKHISIDSFRAALSPEDKAREIQLLRARGKFVAMIGKEFRDLPALLNADVSVLLVDGNFVLTNGDIKMDFELDDLQKFMDIRQIAEKARSIIKQNKQLAYLSWICLIPPSLMMVLDSPLIPFNPFFAAVGVTIFTILIIINSFRMK